MRFSRRTGHALLTKPVQQAHALGRTKRQIKPRHRPLRRRPQRLPRPRRPALQQGAERLTRHLAIRLHQQIDRRTGPPSRRLTMPGVIVLPTLRHLAQVVALGVRSGQPPDRQHTLDVARALGHPRTTVPICVSCGALAVLKGGKVQRGQEEATWCCCGMGRGLAGALVGVVEFGGVVTSLLASGGRCAVGRETEPPHGRGSGYVPRLRAAARPRVHLGQRP
jgi:hypothetical protein